MESTWRGREGVIWGMNSIQGARGEQSKEGFLCPWLNQPGGREKPFNLGQEALG